MMWRLIGAFLIVVVCCAADSPIPQRIALIIGNGTYEFAEPLPNALTDAAAISDRLHALGFKVEPSTLDLNHDALARAVDGFNDDLRTAGPNVIGFVYYAGHAAQDRLGVNYLLPIDAKTGTPDDVKAMGVPLPPVLQAMEDANNDVNIVVIDACRDWFKDDRTADDPRGLADMGLHGSVLIAYATRAYDTADEAPDATSSPFSRRFLEALSEEPTVPVALVFNDVQSKVYSDTDSFQLPLNVNGLVRAGRWAFSDGSLRTVSDTPRPPQVDVALSPDLDQLDQYRDALLKFTGGKASYVDALLKRRDVLQKYNINTKQRLAYFLGAVGFESGGFLQQSETFKYSANYLVAHFAAIKSLAVAADLVKRGPEATANFVYANRLGNGPEASGDGWRYRGRGIFFLTGRANYLKYGTLIGADLIAAPDLASDLETSIVLAAAIWSETGANAAADNNDLAGATKRFLGGAALAMDARTKWLMLAQRALGAAH